MKNPAFARVTPVLICIFILSSLTFGQETKKDFARILNQGGSVAWQVRVPHKSVTLTVSTPTGEVFRKEFKGGSLPIFSLVSNEGANYRDGAFKFQLVLTPILSPGIEDTLAQARIDGNSDEVAEDLRKRGLLPAEMIHSGTFRVVGGQIFTSNDFASESESIRTAPGQTKVDSENESTQKSSVSDVPIDGAQTIATDLIVQGSGCFGFDCNSSESFGFDTLRLKENNLRLHFDDTSNSAGFPSTDWRLVANDAANGGANRFSIEDASAGRTPFTVEGGAPNNSLYVDDAGRIGVKTATPVVEIHNRDGDSPTIRLEQDSSAGFGPQTWDIAGNETNFFVRDVTNGSRLPFKIKPGAATDAIVIGSNGGVGFGAGSAPTDPFKVGTDLLKLDSAGKLTVKSMSLLSGGGGTITFADGTQQATAASGTGTGGSFLGPNYSTSFVAGGGAISPETFANASRDNGRNQIKVTPGTTGLVTISFNIPTTPNLADAAATQIVYRIRYQDSDGSGTGARLRLLLLGNSIGGGQSSDFVFDSNTGAATGTGYTEVTVCKLASTMTDFAGKTYFFVALLQQGSAAEQIALQQIQVYKANSCP